MEVLAQLHDDHRLIDQQFSRFEELLNERQLARVAELEQLLDQLNDRLSTHIRFEEVHFYAPLKASGQAREDLMAILEAEHEDLLKTLEHLQQLRHRGVSVGDVEFAAHSFHLIEVYRAHADRETRFLFPLLEQLPQRPAAGSRLVSKDMTLNAMTRRFPELLHVLHTFQLDCRWFGSETVEEVAWYHGIQVEDLLEALSQSIVARR